MLSEPHLRLRYDEALQNGILRPENLVVEMDAHPHLPRRTVSSSQMKAADRYRSAGARAFVLRAEELLKKGDPKQAKIQLVMAMHMDRGNVALEALAKELDEAIAAKTAADGKSWNK